MAATNATSDLDSSFVLIDGERGLPQHSVSTITLVYTMSSTLSQPPVSRSPERRTLRTRIIGRRLVAETTFLFTVVISSMLTEEFVNLEVSIYLGTVKRKSLIKTLSL